MGRFIVKISEKALKEIQEHKRAGNKAKNFRKFCWNLKIILLKEWETQNL